MTEAKGRPGAPALPVLLRERALWLLGALLLLFFFRPLFGGETFFFRDLALFSFPQRVRLVELVRSSGLPLWDPYLHGGQPFLANPSNLSLYPTALLYFALPAVTAFNLEIVLHFLLGAFAAYWLARFLGIRPAGAFVAGAVFALCGFTLSTANLLNRLLAMPGAAFLLLFWHRFLIEGRKRWFLASAASGTLVLLAGSPEFFLLALATALGWTFCWPAPTGGARPSWRVAAWAAMGACGAGLSAVQIWPALEVVRQSIRGTGLDYFAVSSWSLSPRRLPELLVPGFLGPTHTLLATDYWGSGLEDLGYPLLVSLYFGIPALGLALAGAAGGAGEPLLPRPFRRFLLFCPAAALLLASGRFLFLTPAVFHALPLSGLLRYPVKALEAAVLPVALLAGAGMDRWFGAPGAAGPSRLARVGLLAGAASALLLGICVARGAPAADSLERFFFSAALPEAGRGLLAAGFLQAGLGAAALAALAWAAARRPNPRLASLAALLVAADLAMAGRNVNPYAPRALLTNEPEAARIVHARLDGGRLYRARDSAQSTVTGPTNRILWRSVRLREALESYAASAYDIPVLFHDDFDSLAQRRLVRLTAMMEKLPWERRLPLLSAGNVTLVLTDRPLSAPGLAPEATISPPSGGPLFLYRNETAAPRVNFVSLWTGVDSETDALKALLSPGFDPRRHAVVEGASPGPHFSGCAPARVESLEQGVMRERLRVAADCSGQLVFSEPHYPGWEATVDGARKPIAIANMAFSAVAIPTGTHVVERAYRPRRVAEGAAISLATALAVVLLGGFLARSRANRQPPAANPLPPFPPGPEASSAGPPVSEPPNGAQGPPARDR
jgi:hypothetical protein